MRLVVLLYKAQNINQQLRARIPTICRGWIPAPPDEVTRPTSFLIAVVQQALHEEALATAHQSMDEAEEETRSWTGLQAQSDTVIQLKRVTRDLRDDIEHERSRRLGLNDNVTRLSSERERDRSDFSFAQLENERNQRSLRDELVNTSRLRGEISELQTRADSQHREHKYLLEMLERKEFLHRKKSRTGDKV